MFKTYLEISLGVSVIILLILAVMPAIRKKYSASLRYALWIFCALALLIPYKIELLPKIHIPQPNNQIAIPVKNIQTDDFNQLDIKSEANLYDTEKILVKGDEKNIDTEKLLTGIWLFGMGAFMAYYFGGYVIFCKRIRPWCRRYDIGDHRGKPYIYECRLLKSPMLIGFIKTRILLPKSDYSEYEMNMILKHETAHYKRGDLYIKLLFVLANAVHWFNPIIYIMRRAANRDLEYSCDELVIKEMDFKARKDYSLIVLKYAGGGVHTTFSTSFSDDKKKLKQRFVNILSKNKKRGIIIGVVACFLVIVCAGMFGFILKNDKVYHGSVYDVYGFETGGEVNSSEAVFNRGKNLFTASFNDESGNRFEIEMIGNPQYFYYDSYLEARFDVKKNGEFVAKNAVGFYEKLPDKVTLLGGGVRIMCGNEEVGFKLIYDFQARAEGKDINGNIIRRGDIGTRNIISKSNSYKAELGFCTSFKLDGIGFDGISIENTNKESALYTHENYSMIDLIMYAASENGEYEISHIAETDDKIKMEEGYIEGEFLIKQLDGMFYKAFTGRLSGIDGDTLTLESLDGENSFIAPINKTYKVAQSSVMTASDTTELNCNVTGLIIDGEEQIEKIPNKNHAIWYNERLGKLHTCIIADIKDGNRIVIQPYNEIEYNPETGEAWGNFIIKKNKMIDFENGESLWKKVFYGTIKGVNTGNPILYSKDGEYIVYITATE